MLVIFSNLLFSATPNAVQENSLNQKPFEDQDFAPRTQDITEEGNYTGLGQAFTADEYANSTNATQQIGPFSNTSYGLGSIDLPPQWTGYKLFAGISGLSDNRSYIYNGTITGARYPWTYEENGDYEGLNTGGTNPRETNWGWYNGTPPAGTTTGALFMHNGYYATLANHYIRPSDYCAWGETIYIDRQGLSGVKFGFNYWANHTNYGAAQLYVQLNTYKKFLPTFEGGAANHSWQYLEYALTTNEIATYLSTPGPITVKIGIQVLIGPFWMTENDGPGGYTFNEIFLDNISLWIRGSAKPSLLQLKFNGTNILDTTYGTGNITLNQIWTNPSSVDFSSLLGNFTSGNATDILLTTSFTLYINRTKSSQTLEGLAGTGFIVSNNTVTNWTIYYYAYTPFQYSNYNFTLRFPTDWIPWAAYDPTPTEVLSQISVSSGQFAVGPSQASKAGLWRIELSVPNYVSQLRIYRNATPSQDSWIESTQFMAGDALNITVQITGATSVVGTTARLDLKLPDGSIWIEQSKSVQLTASGLVKFPVIILPATNQSGYLAGNFEVFVTWNNSRSGSVINETGMMTSSFSVRHRSKLIPDNPIIENLVQNQLVDIYVSFLDEQSDIAITESLLWFTNTTGQVQTMTMINPGYYYAETNLTTADLVGEINISINGTNPLYTGSIANISLRYSILTSLVTDATELTVAWGDTFTFELNFSTQFAPYQGISSAAITTDWDLGFWSIQYKGNGNYTIVGDSSSRLPNRLYTLLVQVDAAGFISKSTAFSVFVVPRETVLSSVLINGGNVTLTKSIDLAVTSDLNFAVKWWDLGSWSLVDSATIQIVGIGSTTYDFSRVGNEYQCFIPGTVLNLGIHYITIAATRANFTDSTMALEIRLHRITPSFRTKENSNSYSINTEDSFTLGIYVDNVDFGGIITGCTVEYSWSEGSGVLTETAGIGYYSTNIGNLKVGTWEFNIRVYIGPNYEYKEYTITVSVAPVEGLPPWVLYLTIGALAGVMVGIFSYVFYFRFPPSVRQARALKRNVKKGGTRPVIVKAIDTLLAEEYMNQTQGLLPPTTQTTLRNRYLKEQKTPKTRREEKFLSQGAHTELKENNEGGQQG